MQAPNILPFDLIIFLLINTLDNPVKPSFRWLRRCFNVVQGKSFSSCIVIGVHFGCGVRAPQSQSPLYYVDA